MIRTDIIRVALAAASVISAETMARVLLDVARSPLNDSGAMYELWCDNCGECGDEYDDEKFCTEEAQIGCILRFLRGEVEANHGEV